MPPVNQQLFSPTGLNLMPFTITPSYFLPIGTVSILILLMAQKAASEALVNLGEASEELFRGDRLPMLNFPDDQE
jgi:hypothetical protein